MPLGLDYVLDSDGSVGEYTSIAIGTDGYPIISYRDITNDDLKVVKCSTASCTGFIQKNTLDSTGNVGAYSSIAIGTDGLPIISYFDSTNGDLKVVKCSTASCGSFYTPLTLDSTGTVGGYTSIVIGTDGLPIISYYDATNFDLKVFSCGDVDCKR